MPDKPTIRETVRKKLEELSDPEYREFHSRLLPGITGIMGVRTPELRGIAKDLKKSGWQEYIKEVSCAWKEKGQGADGVLYDEMIIWGLCICGGCRDWDTAGEYVTAFVPAINNWAVCDIFCGSLKITGRYREEVWHLFPIRQGIRPAFRNRHAVIPLHRPGLSGPRPKTAGPRPSSGLLCQNGRGLGCLRLFRQIPGPGNGISEAEQPGRLDLQ